MKSLKFSLATIAIVFGVVFGASLAKAAVPSVSSAVKIVQPPVVYQPESGKTYHSRLIHFVWSGRGTPEYNFELQKWNGVTKIWESKYAANIYSTSETDFSVLKYGDGKYRFRARTFSYDGGGTYGDWSEWRVFADVASDLSNPPAIISPYFYQNFDNGGVVNISWTSLDNVARYEVWIMYEHDPNQLNWMLEGKYQTQDTNFSKSFTHNGDHSVSVRAIYNDGTYTNWSNPRHFGYTVLAGAAVQ